MQPVFPRTVIFGCWTYWSVISVGVRTMRWLDEWVQVPLAVCYANSWWSNIMYFKMVDLWNNEDYG